MATLKFELQPTQNKFVDFDDLANFSSRLSDCLNRVHKALDTQDKSPRFSVHQAQIGSYVASMNGTGHSGLCMDMFVKTVTTLRDRTPQPARLTNVDVRSFQKLADILDSHTKSITINDSLPIDDVFVAGCDWALSQASVSLGQAIGRLDGLNIHQSKFFRLYPVGIDRGAECFYSDHFHSQVVSLIGKRVRVEGTIHRDPDNIGLDRVTEITSLTEVLEDVELPSLLTLIGLFEHSPVQVGSGWE